jgi:hypothetical protein
LKKYKEAIECFERAIELDPTDANADRNKRNSLKKCNEKNLVIEFVSTVKVDIEN